MYKFLKVLPNSQGAVMFHVKDESGSVLMYNAQDMVKLVNRKLVTGITKQQIYANIKQEWVFVGTDATGGYVLQNTANSTYKVHLTKEKLIQSLQSDAIYVTNVYLRKSAKGTVTLVHKENNSFNKVGAKSSIVSATVYVLTNRWTKDWEIGGYTEVFSTEEKAIAALKKAVLEDRNNGSYPDYWEEDSDNDEWRFCIGDTGCYCEANTEYVIEEMQIR